MWKDCENLVRIDGKTYVEKDYVQGYPRMKELVILSDYIASIK